MISLMSYLTIFHVISWYFIFVRFMPVFPRHPSALTSCPRDHRGRTLEGHLQNLALHKRSQQIRTVDSTARRKKLVIACDCYAPCCCSGGGKGKKGKTKKAEESTESTEPTGLPYLSGGLKIFEDGWVIFYKSFLHTSVWKCKASMFWYVLYFFEPGRSLLGLFVFHRYLKRTPESFQLCSFEKGMCCNNLQTCHPLISIRICSYFIIYAHIWP